DRWLRPLWAADESGVEPEQRVKRIGADIVRGEMDGHCHEGAQDGKGKNPDDHVGFVQSTECSDPDQNEEPEIEAVADDAHFRNADDVTTVDGELALLVREVPGHEVRADRTAVVETQAEDRGPKRDRDSMAQVADVTGR